jgi:hypothetical protein
MLNLPNKVTLVAAAIYAISPVKDAKERKPLWINLDDGARMPFIKASEFLSQYCHGAPYPLVDRAKTAAQLELLTKDTPVTANANTSVDLFLSIASLLT